MIREITTQAAVEAHFGRMETDAEYYARADKAARKRATRKALPLAALALVVGLASCLPEYADASGGLPFMGYCRISEGAPACAARAKSECSIVYGVSVQAQVGYKNALGTENDIPCLSDKGFAAATRAHHDEILVCGIRTKHAQAVLTGDCTPRAFLNHDYRLVST